MSHARREDSVIKEFVSYIADKLYLGLQITDWPDKKLGSIGEIDAVAEGANLRIAIESNMNRGTMIVAIEEIHGSNFPRGLDKICMLILQATDYFNSITSLQNLGGT